MPQKMWKHTCPEGEGRFYCNGLSVSSCSLCGGSGEFDGWHYRMHEAMARYQTLYGLKPIRAHRRMADELFDDVMIRAREACWLVEASVT